MLGESKKEYRKGTVLEVKKDGVWQERDMRIVDGNFINSPYDIRIDGTKLTVSFQGKTTSLQFATGGRSKAPEIKSHRGHSELHYINILPDTDIVVYLMPRSVHYNIVLKSENADHIQKMEAVGDMEIFHKSISMSGVGLNAQRSKQGNGLSQALDKASLRAEYISKLQERDEDEAGFEESGKGGLGQSKDYEQIADEKLYPIELGTILEMIR
jgi:hypothetical protein